MFICISKVNNETCYCNPKGANFKNKFVLIQFLIIVFTNFNIDLCCRLNATTGSRWSITNITTALYRAKRPMYSYRMCWLYCRCETSSAAGSSSLNSAVCHSLFHSFMVNFNKIYTESIFTKTEIVKNCLLHKLIPCA